MKKARYSGDFCFDKNILRTQIVPIELSKDLISNFTSVVANWVRKDVANSDNFIDPSLEIEVRLGTFLKKNNDGAAFKETTNNKGNLKFIDSKNMRFAPSLQPTFFSALANYFEIMHTLSSRTSISPLTSPKLIDIQAFYNKEPDIIGLNQKKEAITIDIGFNHKTASLKDTRITYDLINNKFNMIKKLKSKQKNLDLSVSDTNLRISCCKEEPVSASKHEVIEILKENISAITIFRIKDRKSYRLFGNMLDMTQISEVHPAKDDVFSKIKSFLTSADFSALSTFALEHLYKVETFRSYELEIELFKEDFLTSEEENLKREKLFFERLESLSKNILSIGKSFEFLKTIEDLD